MNSIDITSNTITASRATSNQVTTDLLIAGKVKIGGANIPGQALIQGKSGNQIFEIPSSAYMVNKGKKEITGTGITIKTSILEANVQPTIGNTLTAIAEVGDQFQLFAEGSYTCNASLDTPIFYTSLFDNNETAFEFAQTTTTIARPRFWKLNITYTIVSIVDMQVEVSQSGGVSVTNNVNASRRELLHIGSGGSQDFVSSTDLKINPKIQLEMTQIDQTAICYNSSFKRIFRYS